MKNYNTTQLKPFTYLEKNVVHRDLIAHILRWTYVLNLAEIGMKILDFGCGDAGLYETFYRNKFSPKRYLGLDIRPQVIKANEAKFPKAEFQVVDLTADFDFGQGWDVICSFEVLEHVGKQRVSKVLENIFNHANENTIVLISTPCYDEQVGAAENHTYDSGDGRGVVPQELTVNELMKLFNPYFKVEKVFGTFASQKDYKPLMSQTELALFERLKEYYDSSFLSILFAPLYPEKARNCIWRLKKLTPSDQQMAQVIDISRIENKLF